MSWLDNIRVLPENDVSICKTFMKQRLLLKTQVCASEYSVKEISTSLFNTFVHKILKH